MKVFAVLSCLLLWETETNSLDMTSDETVRALRLGGEDKCLGLQCCEEDCCGPGTSYDFGTKLCVKDTSSSGFDGTYSDAFNQGCVDRGCCESGCCSADLTYDKVLAFCLPKTNLGEIGAACSADSDCVTDFCDSDAGVCTCNTQTGDGCTGDLICVSAQRILPFGSGGPPNCYLPFGAKCVPDGKSVCETNNCDETKLVCACSRTTSFPCDVQNGEECFLLLDGSYTCLERIDCPSVVGADACAGLVEPVVCNGCRYASQCIASNADPKFTSETCTPAPVCPTSIRFCEALGGPRVDCGGCEYQNLCVARSADPSFSESTCMPLPDIFNL